MRPKFVFNTDSGKYSIYNLIKKDCGNIVYFKILSERNETLRIVLVIPRSLAPKETFNITRNGITPSANFGGICYDNVLPGIKIGINNGADVFKLVSASHFTSYSFLTLDFSIENLHLLPDNLQTEILMNLDRIK